MAEHPVDGQAVVILDDLHPEDGAMLQALYSRSPAGVLAHLEKVRSSDTGKFMSRYYVGYGHASIGDCGVTSIFIENYSMLACKAIQDNPLYSGQEASTRYLDFSAQSVVDPYGTPLTRDIQDTWMQLYHTWLPKVEAALQKKYPFDATQYKSEKSWLSAVQVRAFDTMRSYLPVGTTTLFSWTTNLRQARDRLMRLKHHPLPEVQTMARTIFSQLVEKYPHSFGGDELTAGTERYAERDVWHQANAVRDNYESYADLKERFQLTPSEEQQLLAGELVVRENTMDVAAFNRLELPSMKQRPRGGVPARRVDAYGHYNVACAIDFGSYRDLQRHRNGVAPLPLIEPQFGMFSWYVNELRELLGADYAALEAATNAQFDKIAGIPNADPLLTQYLLPMGTTVICSLAYTVPQLLYVGELRSGKTVHPSLRPIAQRMLTLLAEKHPGIALYGDMSADSWTAKRGEQTITEKPVQKAS